MYRIKYVSSNPFSQKELAEDYFHTAQGALIYWVAKDMFHNLTFEDVSHLTEEIMGALEWVGLEDYPMQTEVKFDTPFHWVRIDIHYSE